MESVRAVTEDSVQAVVKSTNSKSFCSERIQCPECNNMVVDLPRHLCGSKHKWSPERVRNVRGNLNIRKERRDKVQHGSVCVGNNKKVKMYICPTEGCGKVVRRIHNHLHKSPHFLKENPKLYREMLNTKIPLDECVKIKVPIHKIKASGHKISTIPSFQADNNKDFNEADINSPDESEGSTEEREETPDATEDVESIEEPPFT